MKQICLSCGCHFPEEFLDTLKPGCTYWKMRNCESLPTEDKRLIWDWQFSIDWDHFLTAYGMAASMSFTMYRHNPKHLFINQVPERKEMSDTQRRDYEKRYFRYQNLQEEKRLLDDLLSLFDMKKSLWGRIRGRLRFIWAQWRGFDRHIENMISQRQSALNNFHLSPKSEEAAPQEETS